MAGAQYVEGQRPGGRRAKERLEGKGRAKQWLEGEGLFERRLRARGIPMKYKVTPPRQVHTYKVQSDASAPGAYV